MKSVLDLLIELIKSMSVVIVIAYVLTRTKMYSSFLSTQKITVKQKLILIMLFGIFSAYGTLSGINIMGAIANIRDLGPAIAGLIGGPAVGIGAGLIGGFHRFTVGGVTTVPCSVATVAAGLFGGLIHRFKKGRFIGIPASVIFMALMETFHMGLVLIMVRPLSVSLPIVRSLWLPMISTNALGMGIFAFIISNLMHERETQRNKEIIESELNVATRIQASMLPSIFPAFPDRSEFDIYAGMHPAKEVGGDFYDFFMLDDNRLAVVIADVSGKGVPAALFMVIAKTLIKNHAQAGESPDDIFTNVNNQLCENNDEGMFVTAWMGILNIDTGSLTYVNAGHNPPLVKRVDGSVEWLKSRPGFVLAGMRNIKYRQNELNLSTGDTLFLYTDGVTEALNERQELFGDARLFDTVGGIKSGVSSAELLHNVSSAVSGFAGEAVQADDITMVGLKMTGE